MVKGSGMEIFAGLSGVASAMVFSNIGAAYGMGKSGTGIAGMGQRYPSKIVKALLPVVMASILGIYGLIVSVMILKKMDLQNYTWKRGYQHMASGLSCGLSALVAGYAIGIVGEIGV